MRWVLVLLLAFELCLSGPALSAEETLTARLSPRGMITSATTAGPLKASPAQKALYEFKAQRIRRHHLSLPAPIAPVAFSATISTNKQIIKSKKEAALSDGIDVTSKVAASTLAKMDYSYVSPCC